MERLKLFLTKNNIEHYEDFDLRQISTIRLGGKVKIIVYPSNTNELKKILKFLHQKKIYFRVFGNLSNVLFIQDLNFPIIVTNKMKTEIKIDDCLVTVSAGVLLSKFCDTMRKNCLSGIEGLSGIPATIGGAIYSNAGAFGYSIFDKLISISVFFDGKIITLQKNDIKFGYHFTSLFGFIVLEATFLFEIRKDYDIIKMFNEYTYIRNKNQPSGFSLGSIYQKVNGYSAGFYIERCGLKGERIGGIVISNKHANFFINDRNGTITDFLRLSNLVENTVLNSFGITLYTEIEKVGNKNEVISRFSYPFKV